MSELPAQTLRSAPPRLGEHSREVLEVSGLGPEQIGQLLDRGIVLQATAAMPAEVAS